MKKITFLFLLCLSSCYSAQLTRQETRFVQLVHSKYALLKRLLTEFDTAFGTYQQILLTGIPNVQRMTLLPQLIAERVAYQALEIHLHDLYDELQIDVQQTHKNFWDRLSNGRCEQEFFDDVDSLCNQCNQTVRFINSQLPSRCILL